jgi:hypothetical protein
MCINFQISHYLGKFINYLTFETKVVVNFICGVWIIWKICTKHVLKNKNKLIILYDTFKYAMIFTMGLSMEK